MGCVSSSLLSQEDEFTRIGGSTSLGHHIVSLTSTTYGFLSTLDSSPMVPPTPPTRFTLGSELNSVRVDSPEVINSWELMEGLDSTANDSFRFSPLPLLKYDENCNPNFFDFDKSRVSMSLNYSNSCNKLQDPSFKSHSQVEEKEDEKENSLSNSANNTNYSLDKFENLCPPNGENKVVIYTTTLRGVRKTFEACNSVRSAIQGHGISVCERDISMDKSFREELRELMSGKESSKLIPPRVFIKGRYIGGAEEVLRILEEGRLGNLLEGLPKSIAGHVCDGCGDIRFLPCFSCNGSCKMVIMVKEDNRERFEEREVVVRCPDCNENGLVLCPICS